MPSSVAISNASYTAIENQLGALKPILTSGQWLNNTNSFRPFSPLSNKTHCIEYVAISVLLHLYDGWCYLGQSLNSLITNNPGVCGHLAYYAELRAAMTFLAANGILTCNGKNYIIDSGGDVHQLSCKDRTHDAVWNLFSELIDPLRNNNHDKINFDQIITPSNIPLRDWVTQFSGSTNWDNVYSKYIKKWGLDLEKYKNDRKSRGLYSYNPTALENYSYFSVTEISDFVDEFWKSANPQIDSGNLCSIDKYILWLTLREIRKVMRWTPSEFKTRTTVMLNNLHLSERQREDYSVFLNARASSLPIFIQLSVKNHGSSIPRDMHKYMIARAFFLLRLSTAACKYLLAKNSINKDTLAFWWRHMGEQKGIWDPNIEPEEFIDLWADIEDSLLDIKTQTILNHKDLFVKESNSLKTLSTTEYILLWGLAI